MKSRILRGRRALREVLEPLLGEHEPRTSSHGAAHGSAHGAMVEPRPSPFGDAYSAARRVNDSSQTGSLRASGRACMKCTTVRTKRGGYLMTLSLNGVRRRTRTDWRALNGCTCAAGVRLPQVIGFAFAHAENVPPADLAARIRWPAQSQQSQDC